MQWNCFNWHWYIFVITSVEIKNQCQFQLSELFFIEQIKNSHGFNTCKQQNNKWNTKKNLAQHSTVLNPNQSLGYRAYQVHWPNLLDPKFASEFRETHKMFWQAGAPQSLSHFLYSYSQTKPPALLCFILFSETFLLCLKWDPQLRIM